MSQREQAAAEQPKPVPGPNALRDHLANERTLLAWVRTSVADDGVKVNIRPFQEAGLLAVKEVIKKW